MAKNSPVETLDNFLNKAVKQKIIHLENEAEQLNGRTIEVEDKNTINFGACTYLGLEFSEKLRQGAKDAIDQYGTQFASSHAYISSGQYSCLENELSKIFDNYPVLVSATTTLGHLSALPTLVHKEDLVILDHQVHASVQMAVETLKAKGTHVEIIRHNDISKLTTLLEEEHRHQKYNNVWYLADGVYSMFGDTARFEDLEALTNRYKRFYLYIDDAHGMGWTGKNGAGVAFSRLSMNSRTVLIVSLCKSFSAAGGALVLPDPELKRRIKTCGGTMIFSGPVQPPMLGAAIASAKLHQSEELKTYQQELHEKIQYCLKRIRAFKLSLVAENLTPIFFIGLGLPQVGYNMVRKLLDDGFFVNLGIFPAVPIKQTGIRFTITNHLSFQDIEELIQKIANHLPKALSDEGKTYQDIARSFNLDPEAIKPKSDHETDNQDQKTSFSINYYETIEAIDQALWDSAMGTRGSFDWEGLKFLETTFQNPNDPVNNWDFHYFLVTDQNDKLLAATFLTEVVIKDDMLSEQSVSELVEKERQQDPFYMTSKTLMMGSFLLKANTYLSIDTILNGKTHSIIY